MSYRNANQLFTPSHWRATGQLFRKPMLYPAELRGLNDLEPVLLYLATAGLQPRPEQRRSNFRRGDPIFLPPTAVILLLTALGGTQQGRCGSSAASLQKVWHMNGA